jgi:hypothetical protein
MSLQEIEVNRKEVLEIVKVNKQKHDKILADAVEGYWLNADKTLKEYKEDRLKELKKYYQKNVKDLKKQIRDDLELVAKRKKNGPFTHLRKVFPEDHSDDYNSVIRKLELCVEDTIELVGNEFDQYVRNKWAWRDSFLTTNCDYAITGAYAISSSYSLSSSLSSSWSSYSLSSSLSSSWLSYSLSSSLSGGTGLIGLTGASGTNGRGGNVGLGTTNPTYSLNVGTVDF